MSQAFHTPKMTTPLITQQKPGRINANFMTISKNSLTKRSRFDAWVLFFSKNILPETTWQSKNLFPPTTVITSQLSPTERAAYSQLTNSQLANLLLALLTSSPNHSDFMVR